MTTAAFSAYCEIIVEIAHENVSRLFTYAVPEGMRVVPGMRVLVPFGPRKLEGYALRVTDASHGAPNGISADKLRAVIRPLETYPALLPALVDLAYWLSERTHCLLVEALRLMLPAEMRGGRVRAKSVQWARIAADAETVEKAMAEKRAPRRAQILQALRSGDKPAAELRKISAEGVSALVARGIIELYGEETLRRPFIDPADADTDFTLTEDQCQALDAILPAMRGGAGRFLLSGVTGSGKTEVYIRAVREALKGGKTAIVLVPEIALTPQMAGWFHRRFGEAAAVLHSRLSAGERFDEWRRIRRGDARVVIGARSAVFAPVQNLGILIVDEEHETTYLSDAHPRYDAREVAQRRCGAEGAALLLSSATPSLVSFARTVHGAKPLPHGLLHFLRAGAEKFDRPAGAGWAGFRRLLRVPAVMAAQRRFAAEAVVGEADVAVWAFDGLPARAAADKRRMAAPVDKQHRLLAPAQALAKRPIQLAAENGAVAAHKLLAHIDDGNLGHRPAEYAARHLQK